MVAFCGQVPKIGCRGMDAGGDLPGHFEAEAGQLGRLVRVVAEQPQRAGTHCLQHLGRRRIVPLVVAVAQCPICGVGVQAAILQCVGVKLRIQADAPAFLAEVEQEASLGGNPLHGLPQLRATIAPLAPEYVPGKALAVQPHQRSGTALRRALQCSLPLAEGQQQVLLAVGEPAEAQHFGNGFEPVREAQRHDDPAAHGGRRCCGLRRCSGFWRKGHLRSSGIGQQVPTLAGRSRQAGRLRVARPFRPSLLEP